MGYANMTEIDKTARQLVDEALRTIYEDREQTYGDPGKNITCIAAMWSGYIGTNLSSEDVCNMMALLKLSRLRNTPQHDDSMIDLIGYTLLSRRIREEQKKSCTPAEVRSIVGNLAATWDDV
jgi:hypothetical protein